MKSKRKRKMYRDINRKKWGIWVETEEGIVYWAWFGGEKGVKLGHPTAFFDYRKLAKPLYDELKKNRIWNYKYSIRSCYLPAPLSKGEI